MRSREGRGSHAYIPYRSTSFERIDLHDAHSQPKKGSNACDPEGRCQAIYNSLELLDVCAHLGIVIQSTAEQDRMGRESASKASLFFSPHDEFDSKEK